jgi:hypothetical protein
MAKKKDQLDITGEDEGKKKAPEEEKKKPEESAPEEEPELSTEPEEQEEEDEPPSRGERRAARGRSRQAELEEELEQARRERDEARTQAMAFLARQPVQPQTNGKTEEDPLGKEWKDIQRETRVLQAEWRARNAQGQPALTQAEIDAFEERGWELEQRKHDVAYRAAAKKHAPPPSQGPQGEHAVMLTMIKAEFPDVVGHPQAAQYADAMFRAKRARGAPDTMETRRAALMDARKEFQLGPVTTSRQPSAATKARFAGPTRGAGGGGDERPTTIRMTREHKRQADAMFPHIKDDGKRHAHWAKTVGADIARES